jgi:hypothetical protein
MAAINSATELSTAEGAQKVPLIYIPLGKFLLQTDVVIDRPVRIIGAGGSRQGPGSEMLVPAGHSGFKFYHSSSSQAGSHGAGGAVVSDLYVRQLSRDTSFALGSCLAASPDIIVDDPAGFRVGQAVRLLGAGRANPMPGVRVSTTAGSPNVTITLSEGAFAGHGLRPTYVPSGIHGDRVAIAGAGLPAGTYVATADGTSCVLSANAASTVIDAVVSVHDDLWGEIRSINGNVITIENNHGNNGISVVGAPLVHADCGFWIKARVTIRDCSVELFQGAGIAVRASSGDTPSAVANLVRIDNCESILNAVGILFDGVDSQGCVVTGGDVRLNREWGSIDQTQTGNTYVGVHYLGSADDNVRSHGYKVVGSTNRSTLPGCYIEGGTWSQLSPVAMTLGGTVPLSDGGFSIGATNDFATLNAHRIGKCQEGSSYSDFAWTWLPYGPRGGTSNPPTLHQVRANLAKWGKSVSWDFRQTNLAGDLSKGWWGTMAGGKSGAAPFLYSDGDAFGGAGPVGQMWFPKGRWDGSAEDLSALYVDDTRARRTLKLDAPPAGGSYGDGVLIRDGDTVEKRIPAVEGVTGSMYIVVGWKRVSGSWVAMRTLTGD